MGVGGVCPPPTHPSHPTPPLSAIKLLQQYWAADYEFGYYRLQLHYCTIRKALLQITMAFLHHYYSITTDYYCITAPLLQHYYRLLLQYSTIKTTLLQNTTALLHRFCYMAFITTKLICITSISMDPLLQHYYI
jgi:hypothetical protein